MGIAYAVSLDFLAGGSAGRSDGVVSDDAMEMQGDGMILKMGWQEWDEYPKRRCCVCINPLVCEGQVCGSRTRSRSEV